MFSFRVFVHDIVTTKYFEMAVMLVICLSSISLAAENPVNENDARNNILNFIDIAFTIVFTMELTLKVNQLFIHIRMLYCIMLNSQVIDQGLVLHRGAYCRDVWNVMDATVVICAIVGFFFNASSDSPGKASKNLSTIKSFRVLRVLRPLKTIKRIPKLKVCILVNTMVMLHITAPLGCF